MIKTVLVSGGTGFIGSHAIRRLIRSDYRVVLLKRSSSDLWRLEGVIDKITSYDVDTSEITLPFEKHRIDAIIHTATNYGRGDEKASEIMTANMLFPLRLLESAVAYNVQVFFNTDSFYNRPVIVGDYLRDYALSKHQIVAWFKLYARRIKIFNFKLQHVYGEMDSLSKFIPYVIERFLANTINIPLTPGGQKRDFVYIADVVNAFTDTLANASRFENGFYEYDIGTGDVMTIRELVLMIRRLTASRTIPGFGDLPYRTYELMESQADIRSVREDIGWTPVTTVEDGLNKTIKWYREQAGLWMCHE